MLEIAAGIVLAVLVLFGSAVALATAQFKFEKAATAGSTSTPTKERLTASAIVASVLAFLGWLLFA
jgi:hypothetical protein